MKHLVHTSEIIDALGGTLAVAAMTQSTRPAVQNWRSFDVFPSKTYLVLTTALAAKGITAPYALWGMIDPTGTVPAQTDQVPA